MDDSPQGASETNDSSLPNRQSTAGNITTALSVLLIVALAGAILYEGYATGQSNPAVLEATVLTTEIEQRRDAFYIPITVRNDGDQTIKEVAVTMNLLDGDTLVAEAETVIAILGEAETANVVFVVAEDPTGLTIEAAIGAYQIAED